MSWLDKGTIRDVLKNWPLTQESRICVVTDGSRILGKSYLLPRCQVISRSLFRCFTGLGDLGVGGSKYLKDSYLDWLFVFTPESIVGISIGKLSLYVAGGG